LQYKKYFDDLILNAKLVYRLSEKVTVLLFCFCIFNCREQAFRKCFAAPISRVECPETELQPLTGNTYKIFLNIQLLTLL